MRNSRRSAALRAAIALAIVIAAAAALSAVWADDDRPPIIVRGGSISFEGGDKDDPAKCCNNWKKDVFGDDYKPEPDNKDGVRGYAVTVTGVSSCSMKDVMGEVVLIYFQYGSDRYRDYSLYVLNVQAKGGLGKREPKIVSPLKLTVKNAADPKQPGVLVDERDGFISGVRIGSDACGFDASQKGSLAIRVQPKTNRQLPNRTPRK